MIFSSLSYEQQTVRLKCLSYISALLFIFAMLHYSVFIGALTQTYFFVIFRHLELSKLSCLGLLLVTVTMVSFHTKSPSEITGWIFRENILSGVTKDVQFATITSVIRVQTQLSAPGAHFSAGNTKQNTFFGTFVII